jgi:lysophospholipase L1-like esterase
MGTRLLRLLLLLALPLLLFAVWLFFPRERPCPSACVVFLGDSIFAKWPLLQPPNELSGMQIVNQALPGDTTGNMLARFRRDVIHLRPRVVVILGGLNDLAQTPLSTIQQNVRVMSQTAGDCKIRVVLATLPPAHKSNGDASPLPAIGQNQILTFNSWLQSFAAQNRFPLADFHSALVDEHGSYQPGLTYDGVHPTADGYQRMEPLLRRAIQNAISNTNSN